MDNKIHLDLVGNDNKLTSTEIDALYFLLDRYTEDSSIVGTCTTDGAYDDAVKALMARFPQLNITAAKLFVRFKDPEVLRVLLDNAVHLSPEGFTSEELLNITDIATWFRGNENIETFDELKYLGTTTLHIKDFTSSLLKSVNLDNIEIFELSGYGPVFCQCKRLQNVGAKGVAFLPKMKRMRTNDSLTYLFSSLSQIKAAYYPAATHLFNTISTYSDSYNDKKAAVQTVKLKVIDFGKNVKNEGGHSFVGNYISGLAQISVIFRNDFTNTLIKKISSQYRFKQIFVPAESVDNYKNNSYITSSVVNDENGVLPISGPEWIAEFGSADEYADIDKYVEDPEEREKIKEAYRNA